MSPKLERDKGKNKIKWDSKIRKLISSLSFFKFWNRKSFWNRKVFEIANPRRYIDFASKPTSTTDSFSKLPTRGPSRRASSRAALLARTTACVRVCVCACVRACERSISTSRKIMGTGSDSVRRSRWVLDCHWSHTLNYRPLPQGSEQENQIQVKLRACLLGNPGIGDAKRPANRLGRRLFRGPAEDTPGHARLGWRARPSSRGSHWFLQKTSSRGSLFLFLHHLCSLTHSLTVDQPVPRRQNTKRHLARDDEQKASKSF